MTRRDFITTGALATAGTAISSPVRSKVGGRMTSLISSPSTPIDLPYVTDGLIACYDGEWNNGLGKHNPNASIWKDLSGNDMSIPIASATPDIGAKYISFRGKQTQVLTYDILESVVRCEAVVQRTVKAVSSSTRQIYALGKVNHLFWRGEGTSQGGPIGYIWYNTYNNRRIFYCVPSVETADCPIAISYLTVSNQPNNHYAPEPYVNGLQHVKSFIYNDADLANRLQIGNTSTVDGETRIYSIRAYERDLTPDEISWNFSIDSVRFGI